MGHLKLERRQFFNREKLSMNDCWIFFLVNLSFRLDTFETLEDVSNLIEDGWLMSQNVASVNHWNDRDKGMFLGKL